MYRSRPQQVRYSGRNLVDIFVKDFGSGTCSNLISKCDPQFFLYLLFLIGQHPPSLLVRKSINLRQISTLPFQYE